MLILPLSLFLTNFTIPNATTHSPRPNTTYSLTDSVHIIWRETNRIKQTKVRVWQRNDSKIDTGRMNITILPEIE